MYHTPGPGQNAWYPAAVAMRTQVLVLVLTTVIGGSHSHRFCSDAQAQSRSSPQEKNPQRPSAALVFMRPKKQ
jgi:hypothetical protein